MLSVFIFCGVGFPLGHASNISTLAMFFNKVLPYLPAHKTHFPQKN
jgi:hypothetical protein